MGDLNNKKAIPTFLFMILQNMYTSQINKDCFVCICLN